MSFCSTMIIIRIRSSSNQYINNVTINHMNKAIIYKNLKRNRQILYILILNNIYFFLSTFPYCITFILFHGEESKNTLGQLSVHILSYTNNSFNFFLYGLSSNKYRKELCGLFKCIFRSIDKKKDTQIIKSEPFLSGTDVWKIIFICVINAVGDFNLKNIFE